MSESTEYSELLEKYKHLQGELENTKQDLYKCKKYIKTAQNLEVEYQDEIKTLQTQGTVEQRKLELKVQQLEDQNQNITTAYNESVEVLEKQLFLKGEEINNLKKELDDIVKLTSSCAPTNNDKIVDELAQLREENLNLNEQVIEYQALLSNCEKEKNTLQEVVKQLEADLENYKETLSSKNEVIQEDKVLIQDLKDENIFIKSELENFKTQPLDNKSRGNSLFAEVDDRRLQLQQNMNTMKTKYLEMKQEHGSLLQEILGLRNQNSTLMAQWEAEVNGRQEDERTILDTYKHQIETLNELVESYKKELQEKSTIDFGSQGMNFLGNLLAMKKEEIEKLKQQMKTRSINYTSLAYDLSQANKENRKCNLRISQLENEIGKLKIKIKEMEILSPVEKKMEANIPKSIVKLPEPIEDKENEKGVRFVESTVEPQVTDRNKYRRRAKLLTSQPIKYT